MRTLLRSFARGHVWVAATTLLSTASPAAADINAVTEWNALIVQFTNAAGRPAPTFMLDAAMAHIAIHDAVQAYQHRFRTYDASIPGASGSMTAAVAAAAHDVLVSRFTVPSPNAALIAQVDTAYNNYLIAKGLAVNDPGVAIGQRAALNVILRRANDGAFPANAEIFVGGTGPGEWRPTPPGLAPMASPWMGNVVPFAQRDTEDLLPEPPPPPLTSRKYARHYNEVKTLGARTGSTRTSEQTTMALFYSGNFLTILNGIVRTVAVARVHDLGDSARLFALANVAAADAAINSWLNKRTFNVWRPSTAIINADLDDNHLTTADPAWLPLINDPPYPDYTSGANSLTAAFMRVLTLFFRDDAWTFQATTNALEGGVPIAPRTYHRFSAVSADVVEARILLGIHFRFADTVARRQGEQSANRAFLRILEPLRRHHGRKDD